MDPDVARSTMIEKANTVLGQHGQGAADAIELAEAVHDLDGWLRMGGFLPDVWTTTGRFTGTTGQEGRKQDVDIAVPTLPFEGLGKEQDDERPRRDGGVCGHETWKAKRGSSLVCGLDRGHEGDHA